MMIGYFSNIKLSSHSYLYAFLIKKNLVRFSAVHYLRTPLIMNVFCILFCTSSGRSKTASLIRLLACAPFYQEVAGTRFPDQANSVFFLVFIIMNS